MIAGNQNEIAHDTIPGNKNHSRTISL